MLIAPSILSPSCLRHAACNTRPATRPQKTAISSHRCRYDSGIMDDVFDFRYIRLLSCAEVRINPVLKCRLFLASSTPNGGQDGRSWLTGKPVIPLRFPLIRAGGAQRILLCEARPAPAGIHSEV
jgi:hypothetical protein